MLQNSAHANTGFLIMNAHVISFGAALWPAMRDPLAGQRGKKGDAPMYVRFSLEAALEKLNAK